MPALQKPILEQRKSKERIKMEWREIPNFKGWLINELGEVKDTKGNIIKPRSDGHGYAQLRKVTNLSVHRAVMLAFKPEEKQVLVRHLDGNKHNNRLDNLAWGTHKENSDDMVRHGTAARSGESRRGEKNGCARLTETEVLDIRKRAETESKASISRYYNVGETTIWNIVQRQRWKHI